MSAVIPPKPAKRALPKLSLAPKPESTSNETPSLTIAPPTASTSAFPSTVHSTSPSAIRPAPGRPSLKLVAVEKSLSNLSLAPPSRYRTALNSGPESSSESELDDEQPSPAIWGLGEHARMTGELLNVIRGTPAAMTLEDELSGKTRRARTGSKFGERKPSFTQNAIKTTNTSPDSQRVGDHGLYKISTPTRSNVEDDENDDEANESAIEQEIQVTPGNLQDLGRLGEGTSGEVRKVLHKPSGIIMAKKTISTSPDPKVHKQHLRELLFMRDCSHPAIVQYFGAFLDDKSSQIDICMEFCQAGSLESLYKKVKAHGWRTGEKVLGKIAESMISGLDYLHTRKIVHRDIKPSNVLVTLSGQVKLCDFGVSGELVNSMANTWIGTVFYLSPERIRGEKYSMNSDVWSTGLTVLEVALNRYPFPAEHEPPISNPIELLMYLAKFDQTYLKDEPELNIKYTNAFKNFVSLCLEVDPKKRPTPKELFAHGWIKRSRERNPPTDLARWVKDLF